MSQTQIKRKASLYGLMLGDAMGCPVEGWSAKKIKNTYGQLDTMVESPSKSYWRPKGLHSDDGQQAIALLDAILENPDNPAPAFARILVELYTHGTTSKTFFGLHRGTGSNFRKTVKALANGADTFEAALVSAGNGNAMMIAPVAWKWFDTLDVMTDRLLSVCLVKQTDERGIAAAAAVAYLVAHAMQHDDWSALEHQDLLNYVHTIEDRVHAHTKHTPHRRATSTALAQMLEHLHDPQQSLLDRIAHQANKTASRPVQCASGYALASVVTSIAISLRNTSFRQSIIDIINIGGDTDTTGAMVGAIMGALDPTLPQDWMDALMANAAFDDRLDALAQNHTSWAPAQPLWQQEAPWTALLSKR